MNMAVVEHGVSTRAMDRWKIEIGRPQRAIARSKRSATLSSFLGRGRRGGFLSHIGRPLIRF